MKTILQLTAAVLISTSLSLFLFLFIQTSPTEVTTEATPPSLPTSYAYNLNGLSEAPSNFVEAANKVLMPWYMSKILQFQTNAFPLRILLWQEKVENV